MTVVFILGTAGVFLAFNWPPLLRQIVLGYLSVAIVTWAALIVTRVLLVPPSLGVPQAAEIRVFPMSDARAQHWHRWFGINVFWLVFVVVTFSLMGTFGFDTMGRFALSIPTSFVQLVLILLAVWLRPSNETDRGAAARKDPSGRLVMAAQPVFHGGLGDPGVRRMDALLVRDRGGGAAGGHRHGAQGRDLRAEAAGTRH